MCHSYVLKIRAFQVVQIGVTTRYRYIFKHIQRLLETAWLELPVFQPLLTASIDSGHSNSEQLLPSHASR